MFPLFSSSRSTFLSVAACCLLAPLPATYAAPAQPKAPVATAARPFAVASPNIGARPSFLWQAKQSQFVMSLCADLRGRIWVGTEDKGLWRFDSTAPQGKQWVQFTISEGLGDNSIYALACDNKGRIWAGHGSHGVSVYNGEEWQNYDLLDGPLGERVFDIAVSPVNGDVWIATNAGLTRYIAEQDTWKYVTRAESDSKAPLPSDQINALSFDSKGTLYAGTATNGLAISSPQSDYQQWRSVKGAEDIPNSPEGKGLPSNLINDVLAAKDGTVYVATTCGLAWSKDGGKTFLFRRGKDWKDKLKGLWRAPAGQHESWVAGAGQIDKSLMRPASAFVPQEMDVKGELLRQDYVTCLAEDAAGLLWVGYWQNGYEVRDPQNEWVSHKGEQDSREAGSNRDYLGSYNWVSAILPQSAGKAGVNRAWVARYGSSFEGPKGGLSLSDDVHKVSAPGEKVVPVNKLQVVVATAKPLLPSPAKALSPAKLQALTQRVLEINASAATLQPGQGFLLGEDWRTQGDWSGRLGTRYTMLAAMQSPLNHEVVADRSYYVEGYLGPNRNRPNLRDHEQPENSLRHWVHWLQTPDPRVLYNPVIGFRREAEWDDNAEEYPTWHEGPDMWVRIEVPAGVHKLSAYFFNKDGTESYNRHRDYLLDLRRLKEPAKSLAKSRVKDFRGGLYSQFLLCGPDIFLLKVGKNNSFNTILPGVFLDKVAGPSTPFEGPKAFWYAGVLLQAPTLEVLTTPEPAAAEITEVVPEAEVTLEGAAKPQKLIPVVTKENDNTEAAVKTAAVNTEAKVEAQTEAQAEAKLESQLQAEVDAQIADMEKQQLVDKPILFEKVEPTTLGGKIGMQQLRESRDLWLQTRKPTPAEKQKRKEWERLASSSKNSVMTSQINSDASHEYSKARFEAAQKLWQALDASYEKNGNAELQWPYRLLAYRAAAQALGTTGSDVKSMRAAIQKGADAKAVQMLGEWRWKLCLWSSAERRAFDFTMHQAFDELNRKNPTLKKIRR